MARLIEFILKKEGELESEQSAAYLYYNQLLVQKTLRQHSEIKSGAIIQAFDQYGSCPERLFPDKNSPYDFVSKHRKIEKPSKKCYEFGKKCNQFFHTEIPQELKAMKCVLENNQPFLVVIKAFDSFNEWNTIATGDIQTPTLAFIATNKFVLHTIMVIGYDDKQRKFKVQVFLGSLWGCEGLGTISYDYLLNPQLTHYIFTIFKKEKTKHVNILSDDTPNKNFTVQ